MFGGQSVESWQAKSIFQALNTLNATTMRYGYREIPLDTIEPSAADDTLVVYGEVGGLRGRRLICDSCGLVAELRLLDINITCDK